MTDSTLIQNVTEFRSGILWHTTSHGMCFAVSAPLQAYLSFLGLHTKLVQGRYKRREHYWLELPDGRILDATADQFDAEMPVVYLGALPKYYRKGMSPGGGEDV